MDFKHFIEQSRNAGDCITITDEVSCRDIPMRIAEEESGENRVLVFENISDYDGAVASNLFGNPERIYRSVGAHDNPSYYQKIDQATQSPPDLALQEMDDQKYDVVANPVLLDQIPNIVHSEHDATPYITSGVVLARNPDTGNHHISYIRLSVLDGNKFYFNPRTPRMKEIAELTVGKGENLEIAVLIGGPVEAMLLGALGFTEDDDELKIAQALSNGELIFADRDLPVPLGTEIVLFGTVEPEYGEEGPFGDMKGLYITNENPICRVTKMWRCKDVNYHSILGGKSQEHVGLARMKMLHQLEHFKQKKSYILDYHLPKYAASQMCLVTVEDGITLDKVDKELFDIRLIEKFVLLNKDTDPTSAEDVLWAMTHRANEEKDFSFVEMENIFGRPGLMIIDATTADPTEWTSIRVKVFE